MKKHLAKIGIAITLFIVGFGLAMIISCRGNLKPVIVEGQPDEYFFKII